MRARLAYHPAPLDGAGGGDLPAAVEAVPRNGFRSVVEVTARMAEGQLWLVYWHMGFHRRAVNAEMTGVRTVMWFAANPMKSLYLVIKS